MKKFVAMLLTVMVLVCSMSITAFAVEGDAATGLGTKKTTLVDADKNRYTVTIDVPGEDGDNRHDEVILMVDGSYSMDNEWRQ